MEFAGLLPEIAQLTAGVTGAGADIFGTIFNGLNARDLQQNSIASQTNQQLQNQDFSQQFNLIQNQHANQFQQSNFNYLQQAQQNSFANAQTMQQNSQSFSAKSQAAGTAANFGGSLISGGLNYLYAKNLMGEQASLQRENFDYTTGKATAALTSAGLPSWLAFMPGATGAMAKQATPISGSNTYASALPGNQTQLLWTGSSSQLAFGAGDVPTAI